jgi:prepilin-type N-terminal cleavage/methylation domain-containing protein
MNERGFTILELLIAMAIGSFMMVGVSGFYFSALRFNAEGNAQTYLQRQGTLVLDELARQVRPATGLAIATCNGNTKSLQVTNTLGTFCFRKNGLQLLEDVALLAGGVGSRDLLSGSPSPLIVTSFCPCLTIVCDPDPVACVNTGLPVLTPVTVTFQLQDKTFKRYDLSNDQLRFTVTLASRN